MSKYTLFLYVDPEELVYSNSSIDVYLVEAHGRYYLTKNGVELAFKNVADTEPDYEKWYADWEKNAIKQLH